MSVILASMGSVAGAGESAFATERQSRYERVTLIFPPGDADDGRQAFLDLKCTVCHRVTAEPGFPDPVSATPGPVLDQALVSRQTRDIVEAIIAPSHSISLNVSDEVKTRMEGVLSPMADYSDAMSVRQLLDLLAYLGTIAE